MKTTYSPKEFGALIGRTTHTLQRWDKEGQLRAHRSPASNRRYYTTEGTPCGVLQADRNSVEATFASCPIQV